MFILFVYLVSMNLLVVKMEENIVTIEIQEGHQETCVIPREVTLTADRKFTLKVRSDYFIKNSYWRHKHHVDPPHHLEKLNHSNFSIHYERTGNTNNTLIYTYSHTQKVHTTLGGSWIFTFELLRNYNPWSHVQMQDVQNCSCNTSVEIVPPAKTHNNATTENPGTFSKTENGYDGVMILLIILVTVFGILLLVQSSFILYGKARNGCKSDRNNDKDPISSKSPKTKRGTKACRNIADRPPLPLPPDEVLMEVPPTSAPPMPVENSYDSNPASPMALKQSCRNKRLDTSDEGVKSPAFARRQMEGPLVPKQSYRNKVSDNSDEEIGSPGFPRRHKEGPLVPKQSYKNKPFGSSDEEFRSPDFPRRQMKGPLVPKQSYRNKALDNSDEELRTPGFVRRQLKAKLAQLPPTGVTACKPKLPKPLPRLTPSPLPEKTPVFHPAHKKEPAPPLHPKNLPIFHPPAACRQPDPRLSDVDWQYETLQPASNYLNNFSDTPYDNICIVGNELVN